MATRNDKDAARAKLEAQQRFGAAEKLQYKSQSARETGVRPWPPHLLPHLEKALESQPGELLAAFGDSYGLTGTGSIEAAVVASDLSPGQQEAMLVMLRELRG